MTAFSGTRLSVGNESMYVTEESGSPAGSSVTDQDMIVVEFILPIIYSKRNSKVTYVGMTGEGYGQTCGN